MLLYLSLIETEQDKIKFEDIFNNYKKTMYYVANSILKDEHYSHDAVQNSFIKIIKHIDKIEDVKCNKTKGFIVTIVKNASIDIYRKLQIDETDNENMKFSDNKSINYLPNGFKEVERTEYDNEVVIIYSNGEDYITFNYLLIENSNLYMDTDNAEISKVQINSYDADYIEKENKSRLVWQDENILYDLKLDYANKEKYSDIKSELIKIAKNIN